MATKETSLEQRIAQLEKKNVQLTKNNGELQKNQKLGTQKEFRTGQTKDFGKVVVTSRQTKFENGTTETISFQEKYFHRKEQKEKLGRSVTMKREHLGDLISFLQDVYGGTDDYSTDDETETTGDQYETMTNAELRSICEERNIPKSGNKETLQGRLRDNNGNGSPTVAADDIMGQLAKLSAADLVAFVTSKQNS